jgi:hypothetical protein
MDRLACLLISTDDGHTSAPLRLRRGTNQILITLHPAHKIPAIRRGKHAFALIESLTIEPGGSRVAVSECSAGVRVQRSTGQVFDRSSNPS